MIKISKSLKDSQEVLLEVNGINDEGKLLYRFIREGEHIALEVTIGGKCVGESFLKDLMGNSLMRFYVGGKRTRLLVRVLKEYYTELKASKEGKCSEPSQEMVLAICSHIENVLRDEEDGLTGVRDLEVKPYEGI